MAKKKLHPILQILIGLLVFFTLGIGLMCYQVWDYIHRCVGVEPRDDAPQIELNKEYSIDDFFEFKRENETVIFNTQLENYSKDFNYEMSDDNRTFTVTEGEGDITIFVSARNDNSPEALSNIITTTIK